MFPLAWYTFDESSGTVAHDTTGGGHDATLQAGASWGTGRKGGAVVLDGKTGYVELPANILQTSTEATVGGWMKLVTVSSWGRLFDFGSGTQKNMFLATATNLTGTPMDFAITTTGNTAGQQNLYVNPTPATTGTWQLVVATIGGGNAEIYVNGSSVGTATAETLTPMALGATPNDWIGRSEYTGDAYLQGSVDDFCVYTRSLSPAEVAVLAR